MLDDAFASHEGNTFHFLLTLGEKFFCHTFREALPFYTDERLKADAEPLLNHYVNHASCCYDVCQLTAQ